ncbi:MAG: hypothetical protein HN348_02735 [Proteobacteria bacterium]|nr:hypothetical protein [Pseudomonadota bacterium]
MTYSTTPQLATVCQDADKSEEYFAASLDGAPNYLGTRVLRAEYLWVLRQDAQKFEEDLGFVIDGNPNSLASVAAENAKEQEKAQHLLAQKGKLFSKKDLEGGE